ncbi:MAG TPA: hypothetical protein VKK79_22905 [Candidatus Lokiarchaeia archaeon]|nr:hypothetical protein [Candidatus Lokiarchaeia archaeon]
MGFTLENKDEEERKEKGGEAGLDYKIENVVATVVVDIKQKIDLNIIARKHADVDYNPERFLGLVMRILKPKVPHSRSARGRWSSMAFSHSPYNFQY